VDITLDLPFLNIHNPFTIDRISVYLDKHSRMSLDTKDYFVKQISHLSKGVVIRSSLSSNFNYDVDKTLKHCESQWLPSHCFYGLIYYK